MQTWRIFLLVSGIRLACFAQAPDSLVPGLPLAELSYYNSDLEKTVTARLQTGNLAPIQLAADKRFLFLAFESGNKNTVEKMELAYRFSSFDSTWNHLCGQGYLVLADLPAGCYEILVKSRVAPDAWSAILRIPLRVSDYFYKEKWFYALCFLSALTLTGLWLFRRRSHSQQAETESPVDVVPTKSSVWLSKLEAASLEAFTAKSPLTAQYLAQKMALSERQLLRRVQVETGMTVRAYLQEMKLQQAKRLLEAKTYGTLAEVAYASGFNTPGYFSKAFEKRFKQHPGALLHT